MSRKNIVEAVPGLTLASPVPRACLSKANRQVVAFRAGVRNYCQLKDRHQKGVLKINVGPFWRLLSRNNGESWVLMTHERYDTEIKKR
ncbi:ParE family toxin-like protein [Enterobacter asburiae]